MTKEEALKNRKTKKKIRITDPNYSNWRINRATTN